MTIAKMERRLADDLHNLWADLDVMDHDDHDNLVYLMRKMTRITNDWQKYRLAGGTALRYSHLQRNNDIDF